MKTKEAKKMAESVIEEFILRWQINPYEWLYEGDIEAEIAQRIRSRLSSLDVQYVRARHEHEHERDNLFSRVTCRPYVKPFKNDRAIHPDIVLWDDSSESPYINSGLWGILWVCEIKTGFSWPRGTENDHERLLRLLSSGRTASACQLIFVQSAEKGSDMCSKAIDEANTNLTVYTVYLPAGKESQR